MKTSMEPIYDQRVTETLAGLMEGKTREELAETFELANWRSLDTYLRRKGFTWDSHNQTYIPAVTKVDDILEELESGAPFKAEMIIKRFEEMGDDSDPRTIAREFGFKDHRELGEYMESKQLLWDSSKKNYVLMTANTGDETMAKTDTLNDTVFKSVGKSGESPMGLMELEPYLPLLQMLLQNKDRLVTLLMPQSEGTLPRYAIPGKAGSQTIYFSDALIRLLKEYCDSKNVKQRDVLEIALTEFFRRYGFQREMDKLLAKC